MEINIALPVYPSVFGGMGFHNNDATLYHIIDKERFYQAICKDYRELSPGFMRTFAGFDDWTKAAMDEFCEYYELMQKRTDTPMYLTAANGKPHFSEEEIAEYCENVAERLDYLYYEKNVRHIRYYCYSNEMSCGMWGVLMKDLARFKKYHEELYRAFNRHKLPIGLLATDASGYNNWDTIDYAAQEMAAITEDYSLHIYERQHDIYDTGFYDFFYQKCREAVDKAIRQFGKRVLLTEIGIQKSDGQIKFSGNTVIDVCRYFDDPVEEAYCALMLTDMVFAAINAGVFSLAFWTYIDHPDPYSCAYSTGDEYARRWGEAERFFSCTMDTKYNRWGFLRWDKNNEPRAPYYCLGFMMKLFKRNSKVLEIETGDPLVRACGVMNNDGSVSIGLMNRSKAEKTAHLNCKLFSKAVRVYEYDPKNVSFNRFGDLPEHIALLAPAAPDITLKPESVLILTTDYTEKSAPVYAKNLRVHENMLSWDEVTDPRHCYYRVYRGSTPDFTPDYECQIASTVATRLPIDAGEKYYKVLSVDKDLNA